MQKQDLIYRKQYMQQLRNMKDQKKVRWLVPLSN